MFAYVKYTDGYKTIVPTDHIKHFEKETCQADLLYSILYEGEYFKGQVLLVKETREEIVEVVNDPSKRIRVPKPRHSVAEEEGTFQEKDVLKKKFKALRTAEVDEKRKSLFAILGEKKAQKKMSPLCPTEKKRKRPHALEEDSNSSDDGGIVPQKIYGGLQSKHQQLKRNYQTLQKDLENYKEKCTDLENSKCNLEKELATYRRANLSLQQNLNEVLERAFSQNSQFLVANTPPATAPSVQQPINEPILENEPLQPEKDGKINIGHNIWLREEAWKKIKCASKDSLFVKELAVGIWGTATLKDKSLTGKQCINKTSARQPLTPVKLTTLKGCFQNWLQNKNLDQEELDRRMAKAGCYITEKIMDINKKEKKMDRK